MSSQPLFYKEAKPLSKERHHDWSLVPVNGFSFAGKTNSLYIAAGEFERASREYPIVFGKDGGDNLFPVVMLGLQTGRNAFVDAKGNWRARYIPAYARRYPFILAAIGEGDKQQFSVCIDESFSGFNQEGKGQPLFDEQGEHTDLLKKAVEFLNGYQQQVVLTNQFCQQLAQLDIFEPMQAVAEKPDGEKVAIGGFHCVSRDKLKALTQKKLAELVKSDQMELIYHHLASLSNINSLQRGAKPAK